MSNIEQNKKETAALAALHRLYAKNGDAMKHLAELEAWEEYCEASLNLSNQDDVDEDASWLDYVDGFKDPSDEDV